MDEHLTGKEVDMNARTKMLAGAMALGVMGWLMLPATAEARMRDADRAAVTVQTAEVDVCMAREGQPRRDGQGPHAGKREGRRDGQGPNAGQRQPRRDGQGPHGEGRRERDNEDCRRR